ncbi:MAG: PocR ligand-binding domain-containing protein, partial [Bacteroidota bacterium]
MNIKSGIKKKHSEKIDIIEFSDLFKIADIQILQDLFADANGVASIITHPDGTAITRPSNFCRLCTDIIHQTEKGKANCQISGILLGTKSAPEPVMRLCLCGGMWDACATITVGDKHIANWMIAQVRNKEVDEQVIMEYADEIGADREKFMTAFHEVPTMELKQFNKISRMLYAFANELSEKAYNNLQYKREIAERDRQNKILTESELRFRTLFETSPSGLLVCDENGIILESNPEIAKNTRYSREEMIGMDIRNLTTPATVPTVSKN